jgi:hypothetical protein
MNQKLRTRPRQPHTATNPFKEFNTEFGFQGLDLLAEGRLGNMDPRGSPTEVFLFRRRNEITDLPEFHRLI